MNIKITDILMQITDSRSVRASIYKQCDGRLRMVTDVWLAIRSFIPEYMALAISDAAIEGRHFSFLTE